MSVTSKVVFSLRLDRVLAVCDARWRGLFYEHEPRSRQLSWGRRGRTCGCRSPSCDHARRAMTTSSGSCLSDKRLTLFQELAGPRATEAPRCSESMPGDPPIDRDAPGG